MPRKLADSHSQNARTKYAGVPKITGYADLAGIAGARKALAETAPSTTEATRVFGESIVRGILQMVQLRRRASSANVQASIQALVGAPRIQRWPCVPPVDL